MWIITVSFRNFNPQNLLITVYAGDCWLDLSSVFDTANLSIVLNPLEKWVGIRDTAPDWFKSYLLNRTFGSGQWCLLFCGPSDLWGFPRLHPAPYCSLHTCCYCDISYITTEFILYWWICQLCKALCNFGLKSAVWIRFIIIIIMCTDWLDSYFSYTRTQTHLKYTVWSHKI